jgi:hypothetical protein
VGGNVPSVSIYTAWTSGVEDRCDSMTWERSWVSDARGEYQGFTYVGWAGKFGNGSSQKASSKYFIQWTKSCGYSLRDTCIE